MKTKGLVSIFLVCFGLLGAYSFDLTQRNREELFLTRQGNRKYQDLRKKLDEKKAVLAEFRFPRTITGKDYAKLEAFRDGLLRGVREGGIEVYDFLRVYQDAIRDKSLDSQRKFASMHPNLLLRLLSRDSLAFLVFFDRDAGFPEIERTIKALLNFRKDVKVSLAGLPYTNYLMNVYSEDIKKKVFPLMFLICFLLTLYFTRDPSAAALLIFPCLFSLVLVLSAVKLFFCHLNIMTSLAPLLVFVINLSLCFHLYFASRDQGDFMRGLRCKRQPVLLMILTTSVGFGSLAVSDIPAIRQFAVISMGGIILTSLFSLGWMSLVREHFAQGPLPVRLIFGKRVSRRVMPMGAVIVVCGAITLGALISFPRIAVVTDATRYFPGKVREAMDKMHRELIGNPNVEVLVERADGKTIEYPDLLNIEKMEKAIGEPGKGISVLSANRLVAEANDLYSGNNALPPFGIAYYTLYSRIDPGIRGAYPHGKGYRMTVLGPTLNDRGFKKLLERLNGIFEGFPRYRVEYSGIEYTMFLAQKGLIKVLAGSFVITLLIITAIIFACFRTGKVLPAFLIVNLVPVMGSLIFICLLGFSINIATVMYFSISLGIIVDGTIHITHDLLHDVPAERHYRMTLLPVIAGSMILITAFGSFGTHDFLPIRQVGVILALTLFLGLLFDLFFLPAFLKRAETS